MSPPGCFAIRSQVAAMGPDRRGATEYDRPFVIDICRIWPTPIKEMCAPGASDLTQTQKRSLLNSKPESNL
jgi:hypothetical protein